MDKTVEEAFSEWWNADLDEEKPQYWLDLKAAYAAGAAHGAAMEREAVLEIVSSVTNGRSWDYLSGDDACNDIAARIRQRGEVK